MIADVNIPFQLGTTNSFLLGMCGVLGILWLVFAVTLQARKLFGRRPPIDDDLEKMRREIYRNKNSVKKEIEAEIDADRERIARLENAQADMQLDRQRKWEELRQEYHGLDIKVATMTGRIEAVLRKLEEMHQ